MTPQVRRNKILSTINNTIIPISATSLSSQLGVSRQIIVGDVALLRAEGHEIISTPRGYTTITKSSNKNQFFGKITCKHTMEDTATELYQIVDLGGIVLNVIVEHEIYGDITGCLNLATRDDVDSFLTKVASSEAKLLSELTHGTHLHTIACRDKSHFNQIVQALQSKQILFQDMS